MRRLLTTVAVFMPAIMAYSQNCGLDTFKAPQYYDTYVEYANDEKNWSIYNVHDPTLYKDSDYYYMYNTDAAFGYDAGSGALKRRSKDLVNWEFVGHAFDGMPQSARDYFKNNGNPNYTDAGIWAPFLTKYKNEYRLYYSAPGGLDNVTFAYIGYATSSSANGPWTDKGMVTAAAVNDTINVIDPSVVIDRENGKHWMAYGSYQTGIYVVELDSITGGLKTPGDRGKRIAGRKGGRHAAIEGPELNYHNGWYYLFVSYDWLGDYYNVRVGRSKSPEGPYLDFNGTNMAEYSDNIPMIEAPYKFKNHIGWQGTGHCSVYDDNGKFYISNQGRPGTSTACMVLHIREIFWVNDWPVVSPERYSAIPQCTVNVDSLVGNWEYIELKTGNTIRKSTTLVLNNDGSFSGISTGTWTLQDSMLTLTYTSTAKVEQHIVSTAWDWENKCATYVFTGISEKGVCAWGKKIHQEAVDKFTTLVNGATYTIRNHNSNMLMEVPNGTDADGVSIKQGGKEITSDAQLWRVIDAGYGYYKLVSQSSSKGRVAEIANGSSANGADMRIWTNQDNDKQLFEIVSNANGFYRILTKASSGASAIDVAGFSVVAGGNIFQWAFLNGINQAWRFTRVDSVPVDTTQNIIPSAIKALQAEQKFAMYPNPCTDGRITIDWQNLTDPNFSIAVYNSLGSEVFSRKNLGSGENELQLGLNNGVYMLKASSKTKTQICRLVISK